MTKDLIERLRMRPSVMYGSACKKGVIEAIRSTAGNLMRQSGNTKVWLDEEGYINIKSFDSSINLLRQWRDYDNTEDINKTPSEKELISAVSEHMICSVRIKGSAENIVERTEYIEGIRIKNEIKISQTEVNDTIHLKFKLSHQVFNYDTITEEDLNFIQIGE